MMRLPAYSLDTDESLPRDCVKRVWILRAGILLLLAGLLARLWVLQVVRYTQYERKASGNRVRLVPTDAPRGGIYDRRGRVLATCRMGYRVSILNLAADRTRPERRRFGAAAAAEEALPRPAPAGQLAELQALLGLPPGEVARITAELSDETRPQFQPAVVRDDLTVTERTRIEERLWRLPNVIIEKVPLRYYPAGAVTAHLVGHVGSISPERLAQRQERQNAEGRALEAELARARRELPDEQVGRIAELSEQLTVLDRLRRRTDLIVGIGGLELQYDQQLEGEAGLRTWQVNARNLPVELMSTADGEAGRALVLNLDLDLQRLAMRLLAGRAGAAVAIDPRDGAVLCLAASPSYDPNLFIPRISRADYQRILDHPKHPLQNRAIQNTYAPGSTFKMVTSTAGLASGVMTPRFGVSCAGGLTIGRRLKRCWSVHGGGIDLTRALAVSCDTYFYAAALRMGPEVIRQAARGYGLGRPTGIDLPHEASGRVPDAEWHQSHHDRPWSAGDTANISIGQGDIACTVLQVAHFCAAVANRGVAYRPQLVREIRDREREHVLRPWLPEVSERIDLPADQLERVRRGMLAAAEGGTASILRLPGVAVAGKTGSAEDPPRPLPHAWIAGFAPYEQPTIAVAVLVENSGHGSEHAGPIARALMAQHLQVGETSE